MHQRLFDLLFDFQLAEQQYEQRKTELGSARVISDGLSERIKAELGKLPSGTVVVAGRTAYRLDGKYLDVRPCVNSENVRIDGAAQRRNVDDHDPASIDANAPSAMVGA